MRLISRVENGLALFEDERGLVVVHHGRCEQRQAGVAMFLVVPAEESLRKSAAVLNTPEAVRELRPVFHGAELAFRIRVVIGDMRAAVGLCNSQIDQQESYRLGTHRGAAISMLRELCALGALVPPT